MTSYKHRFPSHQAHRLSSPRRCEVISVLFRCLVSFMVLALGASEKTRGDGG